MICFNYVISFILWHCVLATNLRVAVVEYKPVDPNIVPNIEKRLAENVANLIKILGEHSKLDLIIYPESVLNAGIPPPDVTTLVDLNENPCSLSKYPDFIKNISCAALNHNTHIILNTVEKEKCTTRNGKNCLRHGFKFYNTDIIFNNKGAIIERYRKFNLFGEYELDGPTTVDKTIITIKNEKIGVLTCFDILFKMPTNQLIADGVHSLAFPSMWFSGLPFLTALQVQQMWAHEYNKNLYASGANNPSRGSGGTGIYYGQNGPITLDIIGRGGTQSYLQPQNLKKITTDNTDNLAKDMDNFHFFKDNLKPYTSKLLDLSKKEQIYQICHVANGGGSPFCCNLNIKMAFNPKLKDNSYTYHLVAYSGTRSFSGVRDAGIDICGIVACFDSSVESCGKRFPSYTKIQWPVTFEQIEIKGNFTLQNRVQYPNSLLSSIRPIHPQYTSWTKRQLDDTIERTWKLNEPQNRLMTFAIYGRNYDLDTTPAHCTKI